MRDEFDRMRDERDAAIERIEAFKKAAGVNATAVVELGLKLEGALKRAEKAEADLAASEDAFLAQSEATARAEALAKRRGEALSHLEIAVDEFLTAYRSSPNWDRLLKLVRRIEAIRKAALADEQGGEERAPMECRHAVANLQQAPDDGADHAVCVAHGEGTCLACEAVEKALIVGHEEGMTMERAAARLRENAAYAEGRAAGVKEERERVLALINVDVCGGSGEARCFHDGCARARAIRRAVEGGS